MEKTFVPGRVGIISLGLMGGSFAKAFAAAGVEVYGRDISEDVLEMSEIETIKGEKCAVIEVTGPIKGKMKDEDAHARMTALAFGLTAPVALGFYDGVFGPGAGSFYMLAFVTLLGYGVVKATAHTKLVNLASNCGSLLLYASTGAVVWPVGLVMAAASFLGAQAGSRLAVNLGSRIIRPLLVAVSGLMALRLLLAPANPWRQALLALF